MSNYDAGHYFLTVLAPIRQQNPANNDVSHIVQLRLDLRALPTARQDAATRHAAEDSPFARVPGIHFARFFILDQLIYNGRRPTNAVLNLLRQVDLVRPERVDQFQNAWLVMTLDMDAPDGSPASLRQASDRLWQGMRPELCRIFGHCLGFETVTDADSWFAYLQRAQVTTTMPFNDYWAEDPPPAPLLRYMAGAALGIVALAVGVVWTGAWSQGWLGLAGLAAFGFVVATVGLVLKLGTTPFPAAPDSDLASVLKALYLQHEFTRFVMARQGADPAALHQAFGAFLAAHAPGNVAAPTQPPGRLPGPGTQAPAATGGTAA